MRRGGLPASNASLFCHSDDGSECDGGEGFRTASRFCVTLKTGALATGGTGLGQLRETRSRFRSPSSRAARVPLGSSLFLHKHAQPTQRRIPIPRYLIKIPLYIRQSLRPQLPHRFPPQSRRARQPGLLERMQMLRDRLARDLRSVREPHDRQRPLRTQPPDDPQTRLVTQRRENNCRVRPFRRRPNRQSRHHRQLSPSPASRDTSR